MKKKEKKQYSIWSNYRFVYRTAWKMNKKTVLYPFLRAGLKIASALMAVVLPAVVVYCLEQQMQMGEIAVVLLSIFILAGLLNAAMSYYGPVGSCLNTILRADGPLTDLVVKTLKIDYEMLEKEEILQIQNKAMESCGGNNRGFENFLTLNGNLLVGIGGLVTYVMLLTTVQPLLVLALLGISIFQLAVFTRVRDYALSHRDEKAKQSRIFEYFSRIAFEKTEGKDIRLFSLRGWLMQIYEHQMGELKTLVRKEKYAYFAYDLCGLGLQLIRDIACYGYLLMRLKDGMDVSEFMIYLGVVSGFSSWFTMIFESIGQISLEAAMVSDLQTWLDYPDTTWQGSGKLSDKDEPAIDIEFDHVSYQYPGSDRNILEDVSFHIRAGEKIALVGINGAGKSTLVKLLCGLYTPTEGRILINGQDLRSVDQDDYQSMVAPVFQDSIQLAFTIAENVSAQKPEKIDYAKCEQALVMAGLGEKIQQLPQGVYTFLEKAIDQNGIELSGGEKQKLMLARVLYKQARLVLLDEPTAAMDSIAEAKTYQLYGDVLQKQTVIFISHRLASTHFCDRILLLENGTIAEEGTHEQLLRQQGTYTKMYEVQKQYYQERGGQA